MNATTQVRHPNRELRQSKQTKSVVTLLLLLSAALITVVTVDGWPVLQGGQFIQVAYGIIYVVSAVLVSRWNRGTLPLASALAMILIIISAVAAPGWFERDKAGFEDPLIASSALGALTLMLIPLQVLLIVFALRGFRQNWNIETSTVDVREPLS